MLITIFIEILLSHVLIGQSQALDYEDTLLMLEPDLTPSVVATIPDLVKEILLHTGKHRTLHDRIMLSSNGVANRFIITRWGIRPSQRRRYKNLFAAVRKECRKYFKYILNCGRITCERKGVSSTYGVFKFDEIRGNLILGFARIDQLPYP